MRGLLIKDFKLLKTQKNYFMVVFAVAIAQTVLSPDVTFALGFFVFVMSLFTLSTVSYDEFDNGNAFLFSLPITRTTYVVEKYCFGLLLVGCSWIIATIMVSVAGFVKETASIQEILVTALTILPMVLVIEAVMLPFQLKFGGEKGRIAMIGAIGLLFVIGFIVVKIVEVVNIDLSAVFSDFSSVSIWGLIAVLTAAAVFIWLASVRISLSVMNKKEF